MGCCYTLQLQVRLGFVVIKYKVSYAPVSAIALLISILDIGILEAVLD